MSSIRICIGHDNDFLIITVSIIKIVADAGSQSMNDGIQFLVLLNIRYLGSFGV
ncbi:hypothetical protein SDC9_120332 [bioreactor metagenome]|uniref:Uncharacterized protein n=1 Tax=bioreactor metagenome TaxID=1076179 RepID=A0A645C6P5_9ZZZZ